MGGTLKLPDQMHSQCRSNLIGVSLAPKSEEKQK